MSGMGSWRAKAAVLLLLVGSSSARCASAGHASAGDAGEDRRAAITRASRAFAAKFCPPYARCNPVEFEDYFHDEASCVDRESLYFERSRFGDGSNTTPGDLDACTAAVDFSTCDGFHRLTYEHVLPD